MTGVGSVSLQGRVHVSDAGRGARGPREVRRACGWAGVFRRRGDAPNGEPLHPGRHGDGRARGRAGVPVAAAKPRTAVAVNTSSTDTVIHATPLASPKARRTARSRAECTSELHITWQSVFALPALAAPGAKLREHPPRYRFVYAVNARASKGPPSLSLRGNALPLDLAMCIGPQGPLLRLRRMRIYGARP